MNDPSVEFRWLVIAAALLLVATGCGSDAGQLEGRWDGADRATLTLAADGTAEGNDGCNTFGGEWETSTDTTATLRVLESTEMACAGITSWQDAATVTVDGDRLSIEDDAGTVLAELSRSD